MLELADAETYVCRDCGHVHAVKGRDRSYGDYTAAVPGHSDICNCDAKLPMVCKFCGTDQPDDLCDRGRCDDPRVP
jgi:hypothetical protein